MMKNTPPIPQDLDVLCISSIDWDFIWQGHQEIMTAFARQGHRVLFVENTGIRVPCLRDLPRLKRRFRNWRSGSKGLRQVQDNLSIYSPLILPFPYSRIARWINGALLRWKVAHWRRASARSRLVVWTFLPTPLARDLIRALKPALTVYYCIDDLASSSPQARRIRRSEHQLFRDADLVFVTSEKLRERAALYADTVHLFPFGVAFGQFDAFRRQVDGVPEDLRVIPPPLVGYVGGVHQWVDQDLLGAVAERLPDMHFALVGPPQTDVTKLVRHPNVHLLGPRAHAELPRYIRGFSVGIIPYQLSEYTRHVYPTKLNEYLAMGIPVVATDLPEVRRFNAEHGEVVAVARDVGEFVAALRAASEPARQEIVNRRIEVARLNSWESRIASMSALLEDRLHHRVLDTMGVVSDET